jgi:IS66 Orf2 like protein
MLPQSDSLTRPERTYRDARYKRLEEGTFAAPRPAGDSRSVQLSSDELALLLSGVDLASVSQRKRYERRPA